MIEKTGITAFLGSGEQNGDETTSACNDEKYKNGEEEEKFYGQK